MNLQAFFLTESLRDKESPCSNKLNMFLCLSLDIPSPESITINLITVLLGTRYRSKPSDDTYLLGSSMFLTREFCFDLHSFTRSTLNLIQPLGVNF